jgi:hypothetical protein
MFFIDSRYRSLASSKDVWRQMCSYTALIILQQSMNLKIGKERGVWKKRNFMMPHADKGNINSFSSVSLWRQRKVTLQSKEIASSFRADTQIVVMIFPVFVLSFQTQTSLVSRILCSFVGKLSYLSVLSMFETHQRCNAIHTL